MKIAVIGYSGSGKSTLAKFLSEAYGANVLYLDKVHWLPNWTERPREESKEIVRTFLNDHESWVIDGNYGKLFFERRMEEADQIVFLNFNRFACIRRAFKRKKEYKGRTRESMTEDCPEKIDLEFFWWLLFTGRTKDRRKRFESVKARYPEKTLELRNQKSLDTFKEDVKRKTKER